MILLAEDDVRIAKLLKNLLHKDGYEVDHAQDGEEALMYASMNEYELIILDWMMPGKTGTEVCTLLRSQGFNGGILMLTAKDTIDDKILGLQSGADDYLVKPFEYRELKARIMALNRRSSRVIQEDIYQRGPFHLNRTLHTGYYQEVNLNLSNKEYHLFSLLLENAPNAIPRPTIIDRVWGIDSEITNNNLDAFVRLLRKKLRQHIDYDVIISVRGIGYKMEV